MKPGLIICALLLCVPSPARAVDRAGIAALPELGRAASKTGVTLLVRGRLGAGDASRALQRVREVVADFDARFAAPQRTRREVELCLLESPAAYDRFSDQVMGSRPSPLGFYQPDARVVVVNFRAGLRNMSHELVHALVDADFPEVPAWLTEGLGSLYGGSDVTPHGLRFRVNYRMRDARAALVHGELPTLAELAGASPDAIYGPRAMMWYGYARAVLLCLEAHGQLEAFYAAVRSGGGVAHALEGRLDDHAVRSFIRSARPGTLIEPRRQARP